MTSEIEAIPVAEPLGWKKTDDGQMALIGFKTPDGEETVLALDKEALRKFMLCVIDATGAFPLQRGLGRKEDSLLSTVWYEAGQVAGTSDYYLSFFREGGGHVSFGFGRGMAEGIVEAMTASLSAPSNPPKQ